MDKVQALPVREGQDQVNCRRTRGKKETRKITNVECFYNNNDEVLAQHEQTVDKS